MTCVAELKRRNVIRMAGLYLADESLKVIEQLLSISAGGVMSIERLKLDPVWDPLRKDPRFEGLIKAGGAGVAH
jgi:hypothetical protein